MSEERTDRAAGKADNKKACPTGEKYLFYRMISCFSSRHRVFYILIFLFLAGCAGKPAFRDDGIMMKGKKPYSGKIVERNTLLRARSIRYYNKGIKVLETCFSDAGDSLSLSVYNPSSGRLLREKTWNEGRVQRQIMYDEKGRIREDRDYDSLGKLTKTSLFDYDHYGRIRSQSEYDSQGRPVFESDYDEAGGELRIRRYRNGRIVAELLHRGKFPVSETLFNESGRMKTTRKFGPEGLLREETVYDDAGTVVNRLRYRYRYDGDMNVIETIVEDLHGTVRHLGPPESP